MVEQAPMSLRRVLLVDTSRATLEVCVGVLNDLGVGEIVALQDGYEALGRLLKEPFDAVITSLRVPTIDGQTLTPVLRAIAGPNQRTPVILLTSSAVALDSTAVRPDHVVEKNLHMRQRLKRILGELKGAIEPATRPATAKIDRVLKKIVLVDDSPAIHQLLRASFKRFPEIAIATLEDPTTAVDFVRHEQPDFVLLDLNMPQLSGKEVMRDIKASTDLQTIPVAFFTADESVEERAKLIDLGACHVFKKPFFPKTFADELIRIYNER
jgi:CheY-like chemotaxis protein